MCLVVFNFNFDTHWRSFHNSKNANCDGFDGCDGWRLNKLHVFRLEPNRGHIAVYDIFLLDIQKNRPFQGHP
jgi:hypothetical protein